jgi:predicted kinase
VIHVIGLVGAGKTYFIQHHFPQSAVIFDIKDAYELFNFSPSDLQNNEAAYTQFKQSIDSHIERMYHKILSIDEMKCPHVLLVESTGTNRAINSVLYKYRPYKIWIDPDFKRMDDQYLRERPYADEVNKYVLKKWQKGEIQCNNVYNPNSKKFENPIPKEIQKFLV